MENFDDLFERRLSYPNPDAALRFNDLVGIDDSKHNVVQSICVFFSPGKLRDWGAKHHKGIKKLLDKVLYRPPLIMLAGDVGTGKTELAENVGDVVARQLNIDITLFPISLSTRGSGRVGEMTKLISSAFEYTLNEAQKIQEQR